MNNMFVIIYNNDITDAEKIADTAEEVYELTLEYYYEAAGQELQEAVANATDAKNWAVGAIDGDSYIGADLKIECVNKE